MPFAVASNRSWHRNLPALLAERTGESFLLIDAPSQLTVANLQALEVETVFLPHWSHLIPAEVFERFECVIFHMTDLPFGRGGSPLQNLIVRGIETTMISALRCEAGVDTGPVYIKRPLSLAGSAQEIFLRATDVIADMIVEILRVRPVPQPQQGEATSFRRRHPTDGDWSQVASLMQVYDFIRMLDADGYPPAFVEVGRFRLEFSRAARKDGAIVADVRITEAQNRLEAE